MQGLIATGGGARVRDGPARAGGQAAVRGAAGQQLDGLPAAGEAQGVEHEYQGQQGHPR